MLKVLLLLIAYLIGSIPFSYILGKRFKGIDLREKGSGNLGTNNAYRVLGKSIGTAVFLLDTLKGGLFVFLVKYTGLFAGIDMFNPLVYGFAAVIGHVFPIWMKFRGGKGVATTMGILTVYEPIVGVIAFPIFVLIVLLSRIVSLGSIGAALTTLVVASVIHFFIHTDWYLFTITLLSVILIIYMHRSNFKRLRNHTENRVRFLDNLNDRIKQKKQSRTEKEQ